jgi:hypothetical protein
MQALFTIGIYFGSRNEGRRKTRSVMIEVNAYTNDDILAIKVSGKLSKEDLDDLEPALNKFPTALMIPI